MLSFGKFVELRPQNCILAGSKETHSVCVCTIHQNCLLLVDALNLKKMTGGSQKPMNDYKYCVKRIVCSEPTDRCWLGNCQKCSKVEDLSNFLEYRLGEKNTGLVKFSCWTATDRSTLLTKTNY